MVDILSASLLGKLRAALCNATGRYPNIVMLAMTEMRSGYELIFGVEAHGPNNHVPFTYRLDSDQLVVWTDLTDQGRYAKLAVCSLVDEFQTNNRPDPHR